MSLLKYGLVLITAALFFHYGKGISSSVLHSIAGVVASVAGTLLGFLITSIALMTAVMDRVLVVRMRKSGHYERLITDAFLTCASLLALVLVCILSLFFSGAVNHYIFTAVVIFLVYSFLSATESGHRFYNVITALK